MTTQTYTGSLTVYYCGSCSSPFGVPTTRANRGEEYGGKVWCSVCGFCMSWGAGEIEKLRAQLAREEGKVATARMEAKHAEDRRRAEKAAKTRLKNRIAKGICPCCKRHFANVHRHITSQHPEFVLETGDAKTTPEGV